MTDKIDINVHYGSCGLFRLDERAIQYLGSAVLLGPGAAVLSRDAAEDPLRHGLEQNRMRYWLVAAPASGGATDVFAAPVERLGIAEEPDDSGYHHVAVELNLTAWRKPTGWSLAAISIARCTRHRANELTHLLASQPRRSADWLALAEKAIPDIRETYTGSGSERLIPVVLPDREPPGQPSRWPFGPGPGGPFFRDGS
jgi:hypothetical protein